MAKLSKFQLTRPKALALVRELAMERMGAGRKLHVAVAIDMPKRLIVITVYEVKD